jgi:hypothetical protein
MRIYFERSGGFMGLRITGTVDTDTLPTDEAAHLQEMIEAAGFFELPETLSSSGSGADLFQYKLVVEDKGRQHSLETSDAAAPDSLRPLLRRLTVLARSQPDSSA